eukprot:gene3849-13654_t
MGPDWVLWCDGVPAHARSTGAWGKKKGEELHDELLEILNEVDASPADPTPRSPDLNCAENLIDYIKHLAWELLWAHYITPGRIPAIDAVVTVMAIVERIIPRSALRKFDGAKTDRFSRLLRVKGRQLASSD